MFSYVSLDMRMFLVCGRTYSFGLSHNHIQVKMHFDETNSLKATASLGTMSNLRMYVREKQADLSEEGGRPISTIFMLHEGLSQLITMVTLFCSLSLLFRRTDHSPPPKYAKGRDKSCDFWSTLAVCISEVIEVTDLISHQHHSCPLIIQMHARTNVCYASLKFYMQT